MLHLHKIPPNKTRGTDPDARLVKQMLLRADLHDNVISMVLQHGINGTPGTLVAIDGVDPSSDTATVLNTYLTGDLRYASWGTQRRYGSAVMMAMRYAQQLDTPLQDWNYRHLAEYRQARLQAPENAIVESTWDTDLSALMDFFEHLVRSGHRDDLPATDRQRGRLRFNLKNDSVESVTRDEYVVWREVGIRGINPFTREPIATPDEQSSRNALFADLLVLTGLRLEAASVQLMAELPPVPSDPRVTSLPHMVPAQIVKGKGISREIDLPVPWLRAVDAWVDGRRWVTVNEHQPHLRRMVNAGHLAVAKPVKRGKFSYVDHLGKRCVRKPVDIGLVDRRRLVTLDADGRIDPMALWITGNTATSVATSSWNDVFQAANDKAYAASLDDDRIALLQQAWEIHPHRLRHTFGVYKLMALTQSQNDMVDELAVARQTGDVQRAEELMGLFLSPLTRLNILMGHRSPHTTLRYLTALVRREARYDTATLMHADDFMSVRLAGEQ